MAGHDQNAEALRLLTDGPLTAGDLAAQLHWDTAAAKASLRALQRGRFIQRAQPSGRQPRWELTDRGIALTAATAGQHVQRVTAAALPPVDQDMSIDTSAANAADDSHPVSLEAVDVAGVHLDPEEWAGLLHCARVGAPSTAAATVDRARQLITSVEDKVGLCWTGTGYTLRAPTSAEVPHHSA